MNISLSSAIPLPCLNNDVVPIQALNSLLVIAKEQGLNIDNVLKHAGINFNPLSNSNANVNVISTHSYSKLYHYLMLSLQDEAFGMNCIGRCPPGTFRMMCLYVIHCSTLQKALERSAQFFDFCDSFNTSIPHRREPIIIDSKNDSAICCFYNSLIPHDSHIKSEKKSHQTFNAYLSTLFMMYRFYSWLIGRSLPLISVNFSTRHEKFYNQCSSLFNAPIRFSSKENALVITRECLQAPIIKNEQQLKTFLKKAPYQLITRDQDINNTSLTSKVIAFIGNDFSRDCPNAEQTAHHLNISTRTLHRRLRKEGTRYQSIKDNLRKQAAIAYITHPELTINATASLMGFHDTSAFHRSFKKWTGLSPGEYQKQYGNIFPANK